MIVPLEHVAAGTIRVLGTPLKLSATPASIRTPPPALGQHTDAILADAGLNATEIAALRHAGVVE
jgi:crotonobetainyl-CoA:carnitine CoA-transferase CaiB-like acyl-CoA transferase